MDEPSTPTTGPGGQFAVDFGAIERLGDTPGPACLADVNGDGVANPADFNAWVAAFASQAPGCDQNGDGLCNPADFNAWIVNFQAPISPIETLNEHSAGFFALMMRTAAA